MRLLLFHLMAIVCSSSLFAQDLIVTTSGDSINCQITRQKKDALYFTFVQNGNVQNTLLPMTNVQSFQYNYFATSELQPGDVRYTEIYPHFRFAVNGGGSYNTAKIASSVSADMKNYAEELKSGYNYGFDFAYYFADFAGCGLKYVGTYSTNEMDYVTMNNGNLYSNKLNTTITTTFIGTYLGIRYAGNRSRHIFYADCGVGYLGYRNHQTFFGYYDITGSTVGFLPSISYDFMVTKYFAIGAQLSYMAGLLNEYDWSDGKSSVTVKLDKDSFESLNRLDFSLGARFLFVNK